MKQKILIVDDSLLILKVLRMMLEMHGKEIVTAQDASFLLDTDSELPDLILIDYHIPSISDCENIVHKLKSNARFSHIPVILMSGDVCIEQLFQHLDINDFITKPFTIDDLLEKIECNTLSLPSGCNSLKNVKRC